MPRLPRVGLTEEERIRITLARFEDLSRTGNLTPLADLRDRFGRNPAVLSRVIAATLRSGHVKPTFEHEARTERGTDFEERLRKKYPSLLSAIVLKLDAPLAGSILGEYSDHIHRLLGLAMAGELARGGFLRDGDRIGVGPGRGVYETVRSLQRQPRIRIRNAVLTSLGGVGFLRHGSHSSNLLLDPDFLTALLSESFEYPVTLDLVSAPLVSVPEQETRLTTRWISGGRQRSVMNAAVMGIGTFGPGNRFFEEASAAVPASESLFSPIREALRSLRRTASDSTVPVVGDIGYHLFAISSAMANLSADKKLLLRRQIETINQRLISAHDDDFGRIQSLIIVSGTKEKAGAIDHALASGLVRSTTLCTDWHCAKQLLR